MGANKKKYILSLVIVLLLTQSILHAQFSNRIFMDCVNIYHSSSSRDHLEYELIIISDNKKYKKSDFETTFYVYVKINQRAYDNIVDFIKTYDTKYHVSPNRYGEDSYNTDYIFYNRRAKSVSICKKEEQKFFFQKFIEVLKPSGCTNDEISKIKSELYHHIFNPEEKPERKVVLRVRRHT